MAALEALRSVEPWIYAALGLIGLIFIHRFTVAWDKLQSASFGLEREIAQSHLNQSAIVLVILLTIAVVVFVLVSFVAPASPDLMLPTPTLNLLATATATLPPGMEGTAAVGAPPAAPSTLDPNNGCIPGQIEIVSPTAGQEVSGSVPIIGTATIPNFGFYKFEIKRPNESIWLTIQAGNAPTSANKLADWDTSRLTPGEYLLALVLVDNQAQAMPACVIQLRVARPPEPTIAP